MRIEWRSSGEGNDALLAVDEASNTVQAAWEGTAAALKDFLNEMAELDDHDGGATVEITQGDPQQWGRLVMARSDDGDVVGVDPELYWDRVTYWFRSRGEDPHSWHKTR